MACLGSAVGLFVAVLITALACSPGSASNEEKELDALQLWREGELRGANVYFPPDGPASSAEKIAEGLKALRSWGANLVVVPLQRVYGAEPPYEFNPTALGWTDMYVAAAEKAGLFVCITCRTGPGRADFNRSYEIYQDAAAQEAYVRMWRRIAEHYGHRKSIVGYSLMCEPHPDDLYTKKGMSVAEAAEAMKGTPADWNALARECTNAIREADDSTPIVVGATVWSYPQAFEFLEPTGDSRTVYAVHYYGPHSYSHQEPGADVHYPGEVPGYGGTTEALNREAIRRAFEPVVRFQEDHTVPVLAGEFGVMRWAPDSLEYLRDQLDLFEERGWSWAYWVLRSWNAMDIEGSADHEDKARYPDAPQLQLFKSYFGRNRIYSK
jgi:endoglucanase